MRVAVTGATGFVGARLVRRLIDEGHLVTAIVRRVLPDIEREGVTTVVTELNSVAGQTLQGVDAVVHCAVSESQELDEARMVNRDGTRVVAEAALAGGVSRFVHVSSAAIYDFAALGDVEVDESDPLVPHGQGVTPVDGYPSVYSLTKAEAEGDVMRVAGQGLQVTILRPTGVLGAGHNSAWGTRVPKLYLDGFGFPRHPESTFGFVGVEDLVEAIIASITATDVTIANVVGGHVPFSAYIEALEGLLPGRPSLKRDTTVRPWRGNYATRRLRDVLEVQPKQTFVELMEEISDYWESTAI